MSEQLKAGRPSAAKPAPTLSDLADKRRTVRINFDIDKDEHRRLKILAAISGRSLTDILRELVTRELNHPGRASFDVSRDSGV
jgi:plasmid stability protein